MSLRLTLSAALALASFVCCAQSRPVRIFVPFAPGGASDVYTRIAAQKITEQTGRAFVVENRTGAGGRIAWEAAVRSAPDGSTETSSSASVGSSSSAVGAPTEGA